MFWTVLMVIAPAPFERIDELDWMSNAVVTLWLLTLGAIALIVIVPEPPVVIAEFRLSNTPACLSAEVLPPAPVTVMFPDELVKLPPL